MDALGGEGTASAVGSRRGAWINLGEPYWRRLNIPRFEKAYGVAYIGDFCIKDRDGRWTEQPVAVFYNAEPDLSKGHKHYLGAFIRDDAVFLCDATVVSEVEWNGVIAESGEILISTYRHDYRQSEDGTAMVDGGQDYCRMRGAHVTIRVDGAAMARERAIHGKKRSRGVRGKKSGTDILMLPDGSVTAKTASPADRETDSAQPS